MQPLRPKCLYIKEMIPFNLSHTPLHTLRTKELSFYAGGREKGTDQNVWDTQGDEARKHPQICWGESSVAQKKSLEEMRLQTPEGGQLLGPATVYLQPITLSRLACSLSETLHSPHCEPKARVIPRCSCSFVAESEDTPELLCNSGKSIKKSLHTFDLQVFNG